VVLNGLDDLGGLVLEVLKVKKEEMSGTNGQHAYAQSEEIV